MVTTTIRFRKPGVTPPVYVAGTFTDWQPVELDESEGGDGVHIFVKELDVAPGQHQYKFRLGSGDWWVNDETTAIAEDELGNKNNSITVQPEESRAASSTSDTANASKSHQANVHDQQNNQIVTNQDHAEEQAAESSATGTSTAVPPPTLPIRRNQNPRNLSASNPIQKASSEKSSLSNSSIDSSNASVETNDRKALSSKSSSNGVESGQRQGMLRSFLYYWCRNVAVMIMSWMVYLGSYVGRKVSRR